MDSLHFMESEDSLRHSQVSDILSQLEPFHIPTTHFLKIHLNIILLSTPGSSMWSLSLSLPDQILYTLLLFSVRASCRVHLTLLDLIARNIFGEEYRSLSSSLCSFFLSLVPSSLLGLNILLNTLFSYTLSLRSSLNVNDPYKTAKMTKNNSNYW